jgi:hypothetical protein
MLFNIIIILFSTTIFFFKAIDCETVKIFNGTISPDLCMESLNFHMYEEKAPEQEAYVVKLALTNSNWNFFNYNPFMVNFTIFLLWSPLLFSIIILIFYLISYCSPSKRGHFFYIEINDFTYLDRYKTLFFKSYLIMHNLLFKN